MKRQMMISVLDKNDAEWCFSFRGDPANLQEWREAGLSVYIVEATIPAWVVAAGLARPYAAIQSAWQFMRLW